MRKTSRTEAEVRGAAENGKREERGLRAIVSNAVDYFQHSGGLALGVSHPCHRDRQPVSLSASRSAFRPSPPCEENAEGRIIY